MNRVRAIWILFLCTVLHFLGCSGSYRLVEFEVLEPAPIEFPDQVELLLITNRLPQHHNFLDSSGISKLSKQQLLILDTLITKNIFRGLNEVLKQSPIASFQSPVWSSERPTELLDADYMALTKREVSGLCNENKTDAVISLEWCTFKMEFYCSRFEEDAIYLVYRTILQTNWNIYLPANPLPFHEYHLVDTLYYSANYEDASSPNSSVSEAVRDISYESGFNYGCLLTPVWNITNRNVFSGGNPYLRNGARDTKKGEWDRALKEWIYLSNSGDNTEIAKSFHNMAIYYELEDNLDSASHLINQAVLYDTLPLIKGYQEEINDRVQKRTTVVRQVER